MPMKKNHKKAVALSYQQDKDVAPRIIAKGDLKLAERMISLAKENNIPIQEDESLVQLLSQFELNETIPPELYAVVAEIFAFIYKIDHSIK